jgi:hypothetical protein
MPGAPKNMQVHNQEKDQFGELQCLFQIFFDVNVGDNFAQTSDPNQFQNSE